MKLSSRLIGIHSEKDINSNVISCNTVFLEYAGVKSDNKIIGFSDYDFPWSEYADTYREHELDALAGNNYSTIIPLKNHEGNDLLFMHTKVQKTDSEGNILGVCCRAIEIINPDTANLIKILSKKSPTPRKVYYFGRKNNKLQLSKRQNEILFYLTRGKSPKNIASVLDLSVRTVEKYIDILREKLACRTRWELIDFAINHNIIDEIPLHQTAKELLSKIKT